MARKRARPREVNKGEGMSNKENERGREWRRARENESFVFKSWLVAYVLNIIIYSSSSSSYSSSKISLS